MLLRNYFIDMLLLLTLLKTLSCCINFSELTFRLILICTICLSDRHLSILTNFNYRLTDDISITIKANFMTYNCFNICFYLKKKPNKMFMISTRILGFVQMLFAIYAKRCLRFSRGQNFHCRYQRK